MSKNKKFFHHLAYNYENPVSALLELTMNCNWNCKHCANSDIGGNLLRYENYSSLLTEMKKLGFLFITLSGGEPMLHPDFFKIAGKAVELDFAISIYTNGSQITKDNIDKIANLNPLNVEMSLHGAEAQTHNTFTGMEGSFSDLMKAVDLLKSRNISILLKTNITKNNQEEIEQIKNLVEDLNVEHIFDTVILPKSDGNTDVQSLVADYDFRKYYWSEVFQEEPESNISPSEIKAVCGAGSTGISIGPYGNVFPCPVWRKSLGNIRAQKLKNILNKSALKRVKEVTEQLVKMIDDIPAGKYCNICPGASNLKHGKPDKIDKQRREDAKIRYEQKKNQKKT